MAHAAMWKRGCACLSRNTPTTPAHGRARHAHSCIHHMHNLVFRKFRGCALHSRLFVAYRGGGLALTWRKRLPGMLAEAAPIHVIVTPRFLFCFWSLFGRQGIGLTQKEKLHGEDETEYTTNSLTSSSFKTTVRGRGDGQAQAATQACSEGREGPHTVWPDLVSLVPP